MFIYYPLLLAGTNLAKDGKLPPAIGVWVADAAMAALAGGLRLVLLRR